MRFFKTISITVIALFTIFIIIYSARIAIIKNFAKEQLSLYQIKINCLDISLASNMDIMVDKVCLQSSKADIEIVDMTVQWQYLQWQYFGQFIVTNVDVKRANVKGTEPLFSNRISEEKKLRNEHSNNNQNISQLLSVAVRPFIKQIEQFQLPIKINVAEVSYLPFVVNNKPKTSKNLGVSKKNPYVASLSAVNNTLYFSLKNSDKVEFIKAELNKIKSKSSNKNKAGFSIALSSKLNLLKIFANAHQLPITAELQNTLNANEISGRLDTLIAYQADWLSMKNQITDLTIASDHGIGSSGAFKLMAALNVESRLPLMANKTVNSTQSEKSHINDQKIALTFTGKNAVSLEYSQSHFVAMLERNQVSPAIISILEDNPLTQLTLKPKDNATLVLNNQQINLSGINISGINISASGKKQAHHIKLNNITLDLASNSLAVNDADDNLESSPENRERASYQAANALTIESFIIDSHLKLSNIAKLTTVPVVLHLEGSLQKTDKQTELNLNDNSSITAKNIVLAKQQESPAAKTIKTKNKELLKLQTLTAKVAGNLQLMADNALSVNLKIHSQASQVNIPKILQINSFDLFSDIQGSLDDIHINATASADGVNLGSIIIVGPALSPKVKIAANKLPLTDLLSLNMQLPTKVEIIDGLLDYSVSGQLTDLIKFEKNLLNVSVALTSVSGEVDGIWLQELNWQQNFTLLAGKIVTLPNVEENLTVELIETPTPISKLSINTGWTFNKSFKLSASKLKANVLGGSIFVPKLEWPFEDGHSVNVQLNSINLEQVLALDKKQGIVVTGNISGQLPVTFDGEKYIIEKGELYNISNGLIQVMDNPAVAKLKANSTQLQLAFEALQNLHYHQLSAAVSMAEDGYMLLETVIKGRNPDINNDVNLNLNLSYDLLGLLESMSITERFEESIIKGLQKNKE